MDKQIEHLAKLDQDGGINAVVTYLQNNRVAHELKIHTFDGSGSADKIKRSEWIASAAPNEFRSNYGDLKDNRNTGLSITRLQAYKIILK